MDTRGISCLIVLGLATLLIYGEARAARKIYEPPIRGVIFHSCYDGDTCTMSLPGTHALFGDHISIRLDGIDTPEIKGKCAREKSMAVAARNLVNRRLAAASTIDLEDLGRDKYFRIGARVMADGQDLGAELLRLGLAVPYNGGTKIQDWCQIPAS